MKHYLLFVRIVLFLLLATEVGQVYSQSKEGGPEPFAKGDWIYMMQDPDSKFADVQKLFYEYWATRTDYKGNGYKIFKRWEYINESRVLPDGKLQAPGYVFKEYENYVQKEGKSASGSWTIQGPTSYVGNNTGQPTGMGRVNAVAFHPTDANTIFVGSPSGGFWTTTDGGTSWTNLSSNLPTIGVSSILIHPSTPGTIYIGTGDRDASDALPMGVFKSTDGGTTWTQINSTMGNVTVGVMLMHPSDPAIILAATSGGIYKTSNGGTTWSLKASGNFQDIKFKPGAPTVVYATSASWWDGAKFYRSTDTGDTWTHITSGILNAGTMDAGARMVIGVSANNSSYVYLLQINKDTKTFRTLLRSIDSGEIFATRSTVPNILGYNCDGSGTASQATYDLIITVDPTNADIVYVGSLNNWKSIDGGVTWSIVSHWVGSSFSEPCAASVHADQHWYEWSPLNGNLYVGNDGGIYYTSDGGATWPQITNNLAITQIYKIGQSATNTNYTLFGCQDNGSAATTNGSSFTTTRGGDGMECLIDYSNTNYCYNTYVAGDISRSSTGLLGTYSNVASTGTNGIGSDESGAWVTPYILHETSASVMFAGYENVFRCDNIKASPASSVTFSAISTGETTTCRVLEQSPANVDILYVVRSGSLQRSDNANVAAGSVSWTACTLPGGYTPTDLEAHPTDANIVFATADYAVYKSTDKGATWSDISSNLPGLYINCIVMDKNSNEGLYIGNQTSVWYKDAAMTDWALFSSALPPVDIRELEIYYDATPANSRIKAATYGRGLWQSDLAVVNVLNPTDFTATAVSTSQIDLAWTQNASTDDVLIAWSPTSTFGVPADGNTYSSGNTLPSGGGTVIYNGGLTAYSHISLTANTTYYYKIWSINGTNQYSAGLPPVDAKTYSHNWTAGAGTSDWFTPGNWGSGTVPTSSNGVYIPQSPAFQPSINASGAVCSNITIESGATLTMNASTAYTLSVSGDWTNNGTFTPGIGIVDFNGTNSLQTIKGTSTTNFNILYVNKGTQSNILEATSLITLNAAANPLVLTSGIFKLSSASTITPFTSTNSTYNNLAGLWNNGGTINIGNFTYYLNASLLRLSAGTMNVTSTISYLNNPQIIIEGGQLNVGGRFESNGSNSTVTYSQSGGTITVNTVNSTSTIKAPFHINTAGSFTMSDGTIVIQKASSNTTADYINLATTNTVTGGTLQIGNASTSTSQTIRINSTVSIYNLVVNAYNSPIFKLVTNGLTVLNDVTISGGTLNANDLNLNVGGNWINNGTFTSGTNLVTFNGSSSQTIGGSVATTFNNLTIAGTDVILGSTAASKLTSVSSALTINSSKKLTVATDQFLTVGGTLTNSGGTYGLIVKSDATGTGSLIHTTTNVDATFERYMNNADWANWQDGWHFLSSPVASQAIDPAFTTAPYDFYCWHEPGNVWVNYKNTTTPPTWNTANGSTNFTLGKGYMAAYDAGGSKLFTGTLNVSDVNVSGLPITGSTQTYRSWHLLGNSFASALTWDDTWTKTNIAGVAKIWNEAYQSYSDLTSSPASVIPATNGFFVQVTTDPGSLTLPASKRVHSAVPFYKSTMPELMLKAINLTTGNIQESRFIINSAASQAYDLLFDCEFLHGYAPQFYSMAGAEKLSTNSVDQITINTEIPFSFVKNEGSDFRIDVSGLETLPLNAIWHDLKTGIVTDLNQNPHYQFTAMAGDSPERFVLKFADPGTIDIPEIQVYAGDNALSLLNLNGEVRVEIFNLSGQSLKTVNTGLTSVPVHLATGIYLVRVTSKERADNFKVFVK